MKIIKVLGITLVYKKNICALYFKTLLNSWRQESRESVFVVLIFCNGHVDLEHQGFITADGYQNTHGVLQIYLTISETFLQLSTFCICDKS